MEGEKFYTLNQVAEMLGVHRTTLYDWMNAGKLAYVQVGERRRIAQSALAAFIRAGHPEAPRHEMEESEGIRIPGLMLAA
jgi:excisionase family DNA binding protein